MSNGEVPCCVLEVCCGGDHGQKQKKALAEWLVKHAQVSQPVADRVADELVDRFDFAPKGSLLAFKTEIAKLARAHPYE